MPAMSKQRVPPWFVDRTISHQKMAHRRREFIVTVGSAAVMWPLAARAQQAESPVRIGFLPLGSPSNAYEQSLVEAVRQGLQKAGLRLLR